MEFGIDLDIQEILDGFLLVTNPFNTTTHFLDELYKDGRFEQVNYYVYERTLPVKTGEKIESTAGILRDKISTWYIQLRKIALVGLLSVLVYIGIKIITSSTGEKKAQYKQMLMNWLFALCLLFFIHYMMIITVNLSELILEIFQGQGVDPSGRDALMSDIREEIFDGRNGNFVDIFAYVLVYLTLVILTVMFTWRYLKRVVYIAFLTLISPLICLIYPIEKANDNKCNAFTIWSREYFFNVFIQVLHLLIYSIFVGTGRDLLVSKNPLFAVVTIGFIFSAEKILKSILGFDSAKLGTVLEKGKGGEAIISAINGIANKGRKMKNKFKNNKDFDKSRLRYASTPSDYSSTATNNSIQDVSESNSFIETVENKEPNNEIGFDNSFIKTVENKEPNNEIGFDNSFIETVENKEPNNEIGFDNSFIENLDESNFQEKTEFTNANKQTLLKNKKTHKENRKNKRKNIRAGVNKIGKKYTSNAGKKMGELAVGLLGASIVSPISLAAGLATGDPETMFKAGITGAKTGYKKANSITNNTIESINENKEIINQTEDVLQNEVIESRETEGYVQDILSKLSEDSEFNNSCKGLKIEDKSQKEELIRQYYSHGITKPKDIKKMVVAREKTGASHNQILAAKKIKDYSTEYGVRLVEIEEGLIEKGVYNKEELDRIIKLTDLL